MWIALWRKQLPGLDDEYGQIHCTLVMTKASVTPRRLASIPQIELIGAVLALKISVLIKRKLKMKELTEYFWTDSKVLLGDIGNDFRPFKTFAAECNQYKNKAVQTNEVISN